MGLADLPDLPVIDTSTLPRLLRVPGIGNRGVVSLATLCQLLGVTNGPAPHARGDARATADALLKLLVHAAGASYASLGDLLADHDRGTAQSPRLPGYIRSRRDIDPVLPAAHLAGHDRPLTHAGIADEHRAWLDLAGECAALRCPHLRGEAGLAAPENGAVLLDPLVALLPSLTEPGQPGTLLGAVAELIEGADPAAPTLTHTRALRWWAGQRPLVAASTPCGEVRAEACPDCRAGHGCPRDTIYQPVAQSPRSVRGACSPKPASATGYSAAAPTGASTPGPARTDAAAYMAWLVVTNEDDAGRITAAMKYLEVAMDKNLHLAEPRLALVACEAVIDTGGLAAAEAIADQVLANRTSDLAYEDLRLWLTWHQQAAVRAERALTARTITHPRLARPEGRVNVNPYLPI